MKPTRQKRGSALGAVIGAVVVLALVAFAGLRLNQARDRLMGQIDGLQSELSAAKTRVDALEKEVNTERAARTRAEAAAKESGNTVVQLRQELQSEQQKLTATIQQLEANIQESEQQVAAAEEARTKAEAELSREAELRKVAEQEVATVRDQLTPPAAEPSAEVAAVGTGARAALVAGGAESRSSATTAAKQRFADEEPSVDGSETYDTPPKPLELVSPEYPRSLKREGTQGNVVVAFTVDTRGRVQDVEVREATNSEFESAAVTAVRKWRFKPALRDGEPVQVRISQRLDFTAN
jgi:TonB family protein